MRRRAIGILVCKSIDYLDPQESRFVFDNLKSAVRAAEKYNIVVTLHWPADK
jgi:hypothetical protein